MEKTRSYLKKALAIVLMLVVGVFMLTACSPNKKDMAHLKIVCTSFPQYDWVREIVGDVEGVEVALLQDKGIDLHSYQATADDMIKIKESNLFIYVGGESDDWIEAIIEDNTNPNFNHLNLMSVLGENVKMEEIKEGMEIGNHDHKGHNHGDVTPDEHEHEGEDAHNHDHDADKAHNHDHDAEETHSHDHEHEHEHEDPHDHDHDHLHDLEEDEHVWLSLKNAKLLSIAIADKLATIDNANAEEYQSNAADYIAKLNNLDADYRNVVSKSAKKILLFGDRFPFRYMVDDYGIDYYAAFVGCSAETEASFETVAFLAKKVDELDLHSVLTIDRSSKQLAKTIVGNSNDKSAKILTLNSMQTVDKQQVEGGATYLGIMKDNLEVLKEALK